jgi:propanediol dehydratase large subunit
VRGQSRVCCQLAPLGFDRAAVRGERMVTHCRLSRRAQASEVALAVEAEAGRAAVVAACVDEMAIRIPESIP